jgi:hypothetical protein
MSRTTQLFIGLAAAFALTAAAMTAAEARPRGDYKTDKEFGLGIMLGAPSGLSGKYFLDGGKTALAMGIGSSYDHRYGDYYGTHAHLDVIWHPVLLAKNPSFSLPLYLGAGVRMHDHDYYDRYDDHTHIGLRIPFGIAFDLRKAPLDIFLEFVPTFDFADRHDGSYITGAAGIRYFF